MCIYVILCFQTDITFELLWEGPCHQGDHKAAFPMFSTFTTSLSFPEDGFPLSFHFFWYWGQLSWPSSQLFKWVYAILKASLKPFKILVEWGLAFFPLSPHLRCSRKSRTPAVSKLQPDKIFYACPLLPVKESRETPKSQHLLQTAKPINFTLRIEQDGISYCGTTLSKACLVLRGELLFPGTGRLTWVHETGRNPE